MFDPTRVYSMNPGQGKQPAGLTQQNTHILKQAVPQREPPVFLFSQDISQLDCALRE